MSRPHLTLAFIALLVLVVTPFPAAADTLTLAWDPSTDSQVTGYYVYIGTSSGAYSTVIDVGGATQYTFDQAQPGNTYYVTVAAYAPGSLVSPKAPELSATIGAAPILSNPGNRSTARGAAVSVPLSATDPDNEAIVLAAFGLPPGLTLDGRTGLISGAPTAAGTYQVTITAADASAHVVSESFSWVITATDTTAPNISVTSPTSDPSYSSAASFLTVTGLATDDVGVAAVKWANNRGGGGTAAGTSNWSVVVPLRPGSNVLTFTAIDNARRSSRTVLTVQVPYTPRTARR